MASAGSKGNTKRHSPLQQAHYKAHPHKIKPNKIKRIERHLRKLEKRIDRRAKVGHVIHMDKQAENALKRIRGS